MSHEKDKEPKSQQRQFRERIIRGIRGNNETALMNALLDIDEKLTDRSEARWEDLRDNARELIGDQETVFYLSDNGLSRLAMRLEDDDLLVEPTDNSTPIVKKNWEILANTY